MVLTTSRSLPVNDPILQVHTRILLGSASLLTLRIHQVKCEVPCSFFTAPRRRCSASLRMRWPYPFSLNIVSRSRYDMSPRGWRSGPCPFNTITGFRYGTSIRGLRPNDFSCDFIFIEITKIFVGSPNLTQLILLYLCLRPAMLDSICRVRKRKTRNF
jgi:hypothetical protein